MKSILKCPSIIRLNTRQMMDRMTGRCIECLRGVGLDLSAAMSDAGIIHIALSRSRSGGALVTLANGQSIKVELPGLLSRARHSIGEIWLSPLGLLAARFRRSAYHQSPAHIRNLTREVIHCSWRAVSDQSSHAKIAAQESATVVR